MRTARYFRFACLLAFAASGAWPFAANAAWLPGGTQLAPTPTELQVYSLRALAADNANGAYAVWEMAEPLPDNSLGRSHRLAVERVDVLGDRPAPWTGDGSTIRAWIDNTGSGTFGLEELRMLEDGTGGAILPVVDHAFTVEVVHTFRLYHVLPAGAVSPIPPSGDLPGFLVFDVAADADGAGGVVMIAQRQTFALPPGPPPPNPLFVQRIDATGSLLWPAGVNAPGLELVPPGQALVGRGVAALADGTGGAFFAWIDVRDAADPDVYVQRVDAGGAIASGWPAGGLLVCGAPGLQSSVRLAAGPGGGAIVLWQDERDGSSRVYANAVQASGALAPGIPVDGRRLPSSGVDDVLVELASDGAGGSFVVRETAQASVDITFLHRLDPTMEPRPGWPAEGVAVNTLTPGSGLAGLVADGQGGAFISYNNGFGTLDPEGLYAQHYGAGGSPAPGWGSGGYRLSGTGFIPPMVRSGAGAIVAWDDTRAGQSTVFAQRLVLDGPVGTELSLVSASVTAGVVTLRWFATSGAGLRATVERRTESSGWEALGVADVNGLGYADYVDHTVEPGTRYGYRVTWRDGATVRSAGESWIDVPGRPAVALESPRPNPGAAAVRVGLTLIDGQPARLELVDIAGRRVVARDLSDLGAGHHELTLPETASLAPGVYTLRLVQSGAERRVRLCVVR